MKIYTRTGDDGTTGLFGGGRVAKDHPRVEAYGSLDELNAVLGVARADLVDAIARNAEARDASLLAELAARIEVVQGEMLTIGAEFASAKRPRHIADTTLVERLEGWIDESEEALPALNNFILPGGSRAAASMHLVRVSCRRAERAAWSLIHAIEAGTADGVAPGEATLVYLNRLSDLAFSWARLINAQLDVEDVLWNPRG